MTAEAHHGGYRRLQQAAEPVSETPRWRLLRFPSVSLVRRILAINLLVLVVPVGGLFFQERVRDSLIRQQVEALREQGDIFAESLGESGVVVTPGVGQRLEPARSGTLLRRLSTPTETRARLFGPTGEIIADTRALRSPRGEVRVEALPPPPGEFAPMTKLKGAFEALVRWVPGRNQYAPYRELPELTGNDLEEVRQALFGQASAIVRDAGDAGLVVSVAVPVKRYRQVVGAVVLSGDFEEIEAGLRASRIVLMKSVAVALALTFPLSLYLAGTIGWPLRRLAAAAERVRNGQGRQFEIPDFTSRGDEIGELSRDLRQMTQALWQRMDAIEGFAADVAHEIKNPLTSLRSAVETTARVTDPDQQRQLMAIILEDVTRLDRLISDIADASRLDAELSRAEQEQLNLALMLSALVEVERTRSGPTTPALLLELPDDDLQVTGIEGRLGQVFSNLLSNAISFSPAGGAIRVRAMRGDGFVRVTVEDEGPGIPENKLETVFDRFYSDRRVNQAERTGDHSGLGLSICRQIMDATGGRIWAENRRGANATVQGARFVVEVPAAAADAH